MAASGEIARCRGEDRFYYAPKARKGLHDQPDEEICRGKSEATVKIALSQENQNSVESESENGLDTSPQFPNVSDSEPSLSPVCNLERFMDSVKPRLNGNYAQAMPMMRRGWRTHDIERRLYFVLGDLWESFREWSVYGAGVPIFLNQNDRVVQYYVPYLSGTQIYSDSTKQSSDGDCFRDLSSDGSGSEACDSGLGFSGEDDGFSNSESRLLFEYFERDRPYLREPFADKMEDLCDRFPELRSLRSCDLSPSSWFSVAWYPIYRIPTGPTLMDVDACFLTFHSLHTSTTVNLPVGDDDRPKLSLPAFGLASYKFKGMVWAPRDRDSDLAVSLWRSADRWLRFLQVRHPDFVFFSGR